MTTNDLADPIEAIPVETTTANPVMTIVAWVAVVAAVAFIGFWVWTRWIDPPVGGTIDRYVKGTTGEEFADPNAEFRVTMPTKFQVTSGSNQWGPVVTVSDRPGGDYEFSVTKTPQPVGALDSYQEGLNRLAGRLATDAGAEIVRQDPPVLVGDVGVKPVVYRKGNTYWRADIVLLNDRVYTLIAKTPNDDAGPYRRLNQTFQILGPH